MRPEHDQTATTRRLLHEQAYRLFRAGHSREEVLHQLIELGVERSMALDITSFVAVSYQSDRSEAINAHLQKGALGLIGGLAFTGFTYSMASAGGTFWVATGAILYGLFHLATGLVMLSAKSMTAEDSLRMVTCVLLLGAGGGLLYIVERFAYLPTDTLTVLFTYWVPLIAAYLMVTVGVWGLIDKSSLRLRTDDADSDALTDGEWRKAIWIFLVALCLIVGHIVLKQAVFGFGGEATLSRVVSSPLASPLETPLAGIQR